MIAHIKRRASLFSILGLVAVLAVFVSLFFTSSTFRSVELGIAEHSPLGFAGGYVVPASCPSYAHTTGECDPPADTPPPDYSVTVNPTSVIRGQSATLTWTPIIALLDREDSKIGLLGAFGINVAHAAVAAYTVSIDQGIGSVPESGSTQVSPLVTTTYTVTVTWAGGTRTYSATLTVLPPNGTEDLCSNIAGTQTTVPPGFTRVTSGSQAGQCIQGTSCTPPQTDMCSNVTGCQTSVPSGYAFNNTTGQCDLETCSLGASPSTIQPGSSSTLSWSCSQSSSAAGGGFSTGGAASGSQSVSPSVTTNYTVQCSVGCSTSKTITVINPALTLSVASSRVNPHASTMISWSAANVNSCTLTGGSVSTSCSSGASCASAHTISTGNLTQQTIYTLSCATDVGAKTASATVFITPTVCEVGTAGCPE